MYVIVLSCFGERSSSLLVKKMKTLSGCEHVYFDSLKFICNHYEQLETQYNIAICYESISRWNPYDIHTHQLHTRIQQIWLCPQANYRKDAIIKAFVPHVISIHTMDYRVFARYDAQTLFVSMMEELRKEEFI